MMLPFWVMVVFVMLQRLGELFLSSRNEGRLRLKGAYEVGRRHYKFIVLLHILFFAALIIEVTLLKSVAPTFWPLFLGLFFLAQGLRYWSIITLGERWTTRIIILPGAPRITSGPYRFLRHPNYATVVCEILVFPLIFGAYYTAAVFTLLNALMLSIRINEEDKALDLSRSDMLG